MNYLDKNLLTNEIVIYRTYLHWGVTLKSLVFLIAAYYVGNVVQFLPGALFLGVWALGTFFSTLIERFTSEYAVTNCRVLAKTGFIRRHALEILLAHIAGIEVKQSVLGRVLGFGTIIIHGTGGAYDPIHSVDNPIEFRQTVQNQISSKYTAVGQDL